MRKPLAMAVILPLALAPMVAAPAQAQSIVKQKKLEKDIKAGFQKQGIKVTAKCPKSVTWVKGKTFYCKVTDSTGAKGKVLVKLRSNATRGNLTWEYVANN